MTRRPDDLDDEQVPNETPPATVEGASGGSTARPFAAAWAADAGWATPGTSGGPEPGRVLFEKYRVVRKLGGGGMGDVWLVRHLSLDREHALKVIVPGLASHPGALARFNREFKVMAAFHHEHAATVYDARLDEAGGYIDMEYIRGQTVHEALVAARSRRRPGQPLMPIGWLVRILDQLCDVLQVAHERGIVHRDLKPSNLMLRDGFPPGREQLKVLDFGIAKLRDDLDDNVKTLGYLGTPTYSSSEQVMAGDVDGRSDLYSVGVLLYEFLTGRVPFLGSGTVVMYDHVHRPPPPFAEVSPDLDIPPGVEAVVRRCLAKKPEDRPQSARALFEEFQRAVGRLDPASPGTTEPEDDAGDAPPTIIPTTEKDRRETLPHRVKGHPQGVARDSLAGSGGGRFRAWIAGLLVAAIIGGIAVGLQARFGRTPRRKKPDETKPPAPTIARDRPTAPVPVRSTREPIPAAIVPVGLLATTARVQGIFLARCLECHREGKARGGVKILDRDLLIRKEQVVPGRPDESPLYRLITAEDETAMPPPDQPRLASEEIEAIRAWIADGAPPMPGASPTTPGPAQGGVEFVLGSILADVRSLPREDRPFARYFSLDHLRVGGVTDGGLAMHRDALARAINHLSWERKIVRPRPIDPTGTVFHIDLRALGWDRRPFEKVGDGQPAGPAPVNLFDLALLEYPYGVVPEDSATFDQLADEFLGPAGQVRPVAYVRADWFVSVATQPPLYEDFLRLPRTLAELERRLEIDAEANLRDGRAWRAGMTVSGVSRNNRAVERHPSPFGAYWKSLDFRTSKARENLFTDPIDLKPTGGEVIFHLPNGLQGYLLADARGSRLDAAPTEIVTDRFAEDKVVRNGLSCLRCHDAGMKGFVDDVRPTLDQLPGSPGFDKRRALRLYPGQAEMDRLLKEDADRFGRAIRELQGEATAGEPLIAVTKRYLEEPLPLSVAVAELGLPGPVGVQATFGTPSLATLGLAPLATGGAVRRDAWEDSYDRVVRRLGLGAPILPLDGLTRPDFRPDPADFDVEVATSKKNHVFAPGDSLVITATNRSGKDLFIELIGTNDQGRAATLTTVPTRLAAGRTFRFPAEGAIQVRGNLGKERITLFASDAAFPPGELLRGADVTDRVVHPSFRDARRGPNDFEPSRLLKKTIEIETR